MAKATFKIGDKVFAKIKGYPPWPAKINNIISNKTYNVIFYGTKEVGNCKAENICYYLKNRQVNVTKYIKRMHYETAINEIDNDVEIDGGDGSTAESEQSETNVSRTSTEKKQSKRKTIGELETGSKRTSGAKRRVNAPTSLQELPAKKQRSSEETTTVCSLESEPMKEKFQANEKLNIKLEIDDVKCETVEENELETAEDINQQDHIMEASVVEETAAKDKCDTSTETEKNKIKEIIENKDEEKIEKMEKVESVKMNVEKKSEKQPQKKDDIENIGFVFVPKEMLEYSMFYADHVRKNADAYKAKPVEARLEDNKNAILMVELPSGIACGLKLHKYWPLKKYKNEFERALYDDAVAVKLLDIHNQLSSGKKLPHQINEVEYILNLKETANEIRNNLEKKQIERQSQRLEKLKAEADLITWNSELINSLAVEKAYPDTALECLKGFAEFENRVDKLMFKKHPHFIDAISRLRKYIGNVDEWNMTEKEKQEFRVKAKQIQVEAEKVFHKMKEILNLPEKNETFTDAFHKMVSEFKENCKDLSTKDICILCEEPGSRSAFFQLLEENQNEQKVE